MTKYEHIELLNQTMALAMNMLHNLQPNGLNRVKIIALLNNALTISDCPKDMIEHNQNILKLKLERNINYYDDEINK